MGRVLRVFALAWIAVSSAQAGEPVPLLISELRLRGPGGAADEFIEVYNASAQAFTVQAVDASAGFAIAASDGSVRCTIANGTVLPARGRWLCANTIGYSLSAHPGGPDGATATPDGTYSLVINDGAGIALFASTTALTLANRIDAVGSLSEANALYREGQGYPPITTQALQYSLVRDECGKRGSLTSFGPCAFAGFPGDSDNNALDFVYVELNGAQNLSGQQRLGMPGPQNAAAPRFAGAGLDATPLDACSLPGRGPNTERSTTAITNGSFGSVRFQRTFTNTTGAPITRLRFRAIDLSTFPQSAGNGIADARLLSSSDRQVLVDRPPCGSGTPIITVRGTTVETPPAQTVGGGWAATYAVPAITSAAPLAAGASIDLGFLVGLQAPGRVKLALLPEASPQPAGPLLELECVRAPAVCEVIVFANGFE